MTHTRASLFAGMLALSLVLAGCAGNGSTNDGGESVTVTDSTAAGASEATEADALETEPTDEELDSAESALPIAEPVEPKPMLSATELDDVALTIAYGDTEAMSALAKDIQEGKAEGLVVEIDGLVSNFGAGMSYNIVEPNAEGTESVGTAFVIEGVGEDAYPADGTHVKLTGMVALNEEQTFYVIHTLVTFVEVVE